VIATRILRRHASGARLEIRIHAPELEDRDGRVETWRCKAEIRESGRAARPIVGHGVDSLQALITTLGGIWHALRAEQGEVSWLGQHGRIGLPLLVQDDDPDFVALVFHLIQAEHARAVLVAKRLERFSARAKHRANPSRPRLPRQEAREK